MTTARTATWTAAPTLAVVALVAGCGEPVAGSPVATGEHGPAGAGRALASFDPCAVLSDAELTALGFRPETRDPIDELGQMGCGFLGSRDSPVLGIRLEKDLEETVDDYAARSEAFGSFEENRVNGRPGAVLEVVGDGRGCVQLMNAGSGTVAVDWQFDDPGPVDPCAEALRVAEMIEAELPAVGS
ncbi:MAG: DUF3558 domain-containing protein [Pseudonocardiaceae bacterium]